MPKLPAGIYFITSRLLSTRTLLAVNFNGENAALTVTEFENLPTQLWNVSDFAGGVMQAISPLDVPGFQVAFGGSNTLTVLPTSYYEWSVMGDSGIFTVQDASYVNFWSIQAAQVGETITYGPGSGNEGQTWEFIIA